MTIRSGGRPRDSRKTQQAHPIKQEAPPEPSQPDYRLPRGNGNGGKSGGNGYGSIGSGHGRRGGGGFGGILRFLAFTLVLAAIVLAVLLTALRPMVRDAVLGWASDNPAALDMPFVAEGLK